MFDICLQLVQRTLFLNIYIYTNIYTIFTAQSQVQKLAKILFMSYPVTCMLVLHTIDPLSHLASPAPPAIPRQACSDPMEQRPAELVPRVWKSVRGVPNQCVVTGVQHTEYVSCLQEFLRWKKIDTSIQYTYHWVFKECATKQTDCL